MSQVNISPIPFFSDELKLKHLNEYIEINRSLMPHNIAIATGCNLDEALALLILIFGKNLAEGFILVYHQPHLDIPIDRRPINLGFPPKDPYECPICESQFDNDDEFYYDFEFVLSDDVDFIFNSI